MKVRQKKFRALKLGKCVTQQLYETSQYLGYLYIPLTEITKQVGMIYMILKPTPWSLTHEAKSVMNSIHTESWKVELGSG